jgi:hypothetical protein
MDKGYDSEGIHRLIRESLHANSVIPIRSWKNEAIGGTYRQEMAYQFNDIIYPRRQLVENRFSVLKRKFSGDLKARKFLIQMKEIANKMIVCNLHRFLQFLVVKVFYRANFLYRLSTHTWRDNAPGNYLWYLSGALDPHIGQDIVHGRADIYQHNPEVRTDGSGWHDSKSKDHRVLLKPSPSLRERQSPINSITPPGP